LIGAVTELGRALRRGGAAVSTAEIADAARAAAAIDLGDRELLAAALRTALVKRSRDRPLFDELFAAIFGAARPAIGLEPIFEAAAIDPELAAALIAAIRARGAELDPAIAAALGAGDDLEALLEATGAAALLAEVESPLQLGYASYRAQAAAGLAPADDAVDAIAAMLAREAGAGDRGAEILGQLIRDRLAELRAEIRPLAERRLAINRPQLRRDLSIAALSTRSLAALTPAEVAELSSEVDRLARRLINKVRRQRRSRRLGRLDVARTLRASLATDAVPFELRRRRMRPRRPHVVVLCDISDSVRNVSRFMLQLVYTVAELFQRVRAFAFVAEVGELTDLFAAHRIDRAVELAASGAAVNTFANSNYGRVFEQFRRRHLGALTGRTTVIVIGDGRSNYHDPGVEHLEAIRRRAGRLLWINPEPPSAWGFGDSEMRTYEPICDQVAVAGNLASLSAVIDELV
jgi:hypothetical protein